MRGYLSVAALVITSFFVHVEAQTSVRPQLRNASTLNNILRITKVQKKGQTADVEIEVQRLSDKAITAYGIDLSMRYADGSVRKTAGATDFIETLVPEVRDFPLGYTGLTRYGEYHSLTINVPSDGADAPPVAVSATVAWVVFDDKTVSGSGNGFQMFAESRREESSYLANLVAELRDAEAHPEALAERFDASPGQPVFGSKTVLQKAVLGLKLEAPKTPQAGFRGRRDSDLQTFSVAAAVGKDKFDALLARYASLQVLLAEQCDLKQGN